jgi:hypothetical protein
MQKKPSLNSKIQMSITKSEKIPSTLQEEIYLSFLGTLEVNNFSKEIEKGSRKI